MHFPTIQYRKQREKRFYGEKYIYSRILFTTSLNQRSANTETNSHGHSFTFFRRNRAVFLCVWTRNKGIYLVLCNNHYHKSFFLMEKDAIKEQVFFFITAHTVHEKKCLLNKMVEKNSNWACPLARRWNSEHVLQINNITDCNVEIFCFICLFSEREKTKNTKIFRFHIS